MNSFLVFYSSGSRESSVPMFSVPNVRSENLIHSVITFLSSNGPTKAPGRPQGGLNSQPLVYGALQASWLVLFLSVYFSSHRNCRNITHKFSSYSTCNKPCIYILATFSMDPKKKKNNGQATPIRDNPQAPRATSLILRLILSYEGPSSGDEKSTQKCNQKSIYGS